MQLHTCLAEVSKLHDSDGHAVRLVSLNRVDAAISSQERSHVTSVGEEQAATLKVIDHVSESREHSIVAKVKHCLVDLR